MKVCIAEKPSVASSIANVLGATSRKDGYFEGNGWQVTWAYGHLCQIKYPEEIDSRWKYWSLDNLPMLPTTYGIRLIAGKDTSRQFNVIKRLYSHAELIVNAGDAGQEGELIQRWIMQLAGVHCPVKRLWISSLTEEAIRDGFNDLRPQEEYDNLFQAGLARAEGDWLLGMNATRLYTKKFAGKGTVLSIGRVQTPTLSMIVSRDREIENFKPSPYWVLTTRYKGVDFTSVAGKYAIREKADIALAISERNPFVVDSVMKKEVQERPPQLYDLTALQVDCNKRYGMSAAMTLATLQKLYEAKLTTYPRVDTRYLTHDIYPKCGDILERLSMFGYSEATGPLSGAQPLRRSDRVFDDSKVSDHHALIPTGVKPGTLSDNERKVYDLIVNSFIAVFYPNSVFAQTVVTGHAGEEKFKATGKVAVNRGWRDVLKGTEEDKNDKASSGMMPDFTNGESGEHHPMLQRKMTTPPKRYTEATLLQAMETAGKFVEDETLRAAMKENGIGRPSSRAGIIETLLSKNRQYVVRDKKSLVSTSIGRRLIDTIDERMLKDPATTGLWEKKLRLIEKGEFSLDKFMEALSRQVVDITTRVKGQSSNGPIGERQEVPDYKAMTSTRRRQQGSALVGKRCPQCGKGIIIRGKYSYFCSNHANGCDFTKPLK